MLILWNFILVRYAESNFILCKMIYSVNLNCWWYIFLISLIFCWFEFILLSYIKLPLIKSNSELFLLVPLVWISSVLFNTTWFNYRNFLFRFFFDSTLLLKSVLQKQGKYLLKYFIYLMTLFSKSMYKVYFARKGVCTVASNF